MGRRWEINVIYQIEGIRNICERYCTERHCAVEILFVIVYC